MEILTGNSYLFRKSRFLGYAVVIVKESDVENTVATLMEKNNVQEATKTPFAYRLANCEKEGCDDGNEIGAGDKLLYLLRKWEIENVFVMVARNDRSLSGRLIGSQRYKYILESAKSAIEKCFHAHLEPEEAAKMEMARRGTADGKKGNNCAPYVFQADIQKKKNPKKVGRINHFQAVEKEQETVPEVREQMITKMDSIHVSRDDLDQLRAMRKPQKEVHLVLICIAFLLKVKDITWEGCRRMVLSHTFCGQLLQLEPKKIARKQIQAVRGILQTPEFTPCAICRKSITASNLLQYVITIVEKYDEDYLNRRAPKAPSPTKQTEPTKETTEQMVLDKKPQAYGGQFVQSPPPPQKDYDYLEIEHTDTSDTTPRIVDRARNSSTGVDRSAGAISYGHLTNIQLAFNAPSIKM